MQDARDRQAQLTKPAGALGVLEDASVTLCGIQRTCPPRPLARPVVAVFAADHGVHAQGVTPWPQEVTASMVANFRAGGAAVNVLARRPGPRCTSSTWASPPTVERRRARCSTARSGAARRTCAAGPAMTRERGRSRLSSRVSRSPTQLIAAGHDCLLTGDMGIANTTASAALVAALHRRGRRAT